jgi:transposase
MKGYTMYSMNKKRRTYSKEYKQCCVELVIEQAMTISEAARQLGIGQQMLGRWVAAKRMQLEPKSPKAIIVEKNSKIKELEKRTKDLETELEFLKKAADFFANKPKKGKSSF